MSYIGNAPVIQSTEFREEYFPSASQTAFVTGGFHPSAVSVTRNGVLLSESDYVKGTDNVTITLNSAAVSGDVVVIRGNRSLVQGVAVSESRVEYTWQANDTVVQLNADVVPFYSDVYLNGVKLAAADYTINTVNRTVSFTSAPAVGDVIAVVHRNETSALVGLPIKDSYGNEVLSQSGNAVSIGTLRLPTSGGIQDSSGANVLTEANGTVTLTADEANVGSNALVVDSSGNVGIGTDTVEVGDLQISNGLNIDRKNVAGNPRVYFGHDNFAASTSNFIQVDRNTESMSFQVNDSPRMLIDSSGDVFVSDGGEVRLGTNGRLHVTGNRIYDDNANGNDVGISFSGGGAIVPVDGTGSVSDNSKDLGQSTRRWDDIYATNGTIQTSDAKEKENITTSDLSLDFINQLNPVSYRFIGKTRTHYGLIAQEIETLLSTIGKDTTEFAGFIKSPVTDDEGNETGEYKYGLRYHEFISPIIKAIQEQQALIESQQSQLDALTARIEALEATP